MKYYVVFKGFNPGVYDKWDDAREQVEGFPGALYKSYSGSEEASRAYRMAGSFEDAAELRNLLRGAANARSQTDSHENEESVLELPKDRWPEEIDRTAWAVDASCLGNPGKMEYRAVDLASGKVVFSMGPFPKATNNIGEFLAIVHAMAEMTKRGEIHNIYSDSKTGMAWVRNRRVNTKVKPTQENARVFELMARAVAWLQTHNFPGKILKWETERWGEIPADFGRK